ncbi:MAG: Flp pilus assembly protein CpaB [Pseudomonadota bacterium]
MSNTRALLISLVVAIAAATLLMVYINGREKQLMEMVTPIPVLVATRDIAEGTRMDETLFETKKLPQKYVQPGAFNDPQRIVNRNITVPVLAGTQILETMFGTVQDEGIASKVPAGKRAFSIFMTEVTAVGDLIQPGDMVDLMVTVEVGSYNSQGEGISEEMITKTILENILVLAVNQTSSKRKAIGSATVKQASQGNVLSTTTSSSKNNGQIKTLTLSLTPKEVQMLNLAQEIGTLSASLRSAWDSGTIENTPALSNRELLGIQKTVVPRSRPAWVEIRGSESMSRF